MITLEEMERRNEMRFEILYKSILINGGFSAKEARGIAEDAVFRIRQTIR